MCVCSAARLGCVEKEATMTYTLAIGDCTYSSWSLRGWLLFDAFGIPVRLSRYRL